MSLAFISDAISKFQEGLTKYIGVIGSDHAYIHKGQGFIVSGITGSISAGETYKFYFKTPKAETGKYIHWRPANIYGIATAFTAQIFEGSTSISGGSAATKLNLNRNLIVKSPSIMQAFDAGVTVGADGSQIQIIAGGAGGTGVSNEGGGAGADHERVLKPDTAYTVTLTNRSGSTASTCLYEFFWYEETDGFI